MKEQLVLPLPVRTARGRGDFFVGPAAETAVRLVDQWASWPQGKLVLVGDEGAGKSHLAAIWAAERGAPIIDASAISPESPPETDSIVVEDADRGLSEPAERGLFHLHNIIAERRGHLLLTARTPPTRWPLRLKDLASRMQSATVARLEAPDDTTLGALLLKQFVDRELSPPPTLFDYLLRRMDRSYAATRVLVERIDRLALSRKRPLTRALAKEALDSL